MLSELLASQAPRALGWMLLCSLWQLFIVAMGVALLLALLRKSAANVRYVVTLSALGAMFVPLAATLFSVHREPPERNETSVPAMVTASENANAESVSGDAIRQPTGAPHVAAGWSSLLSRMNSTVGPYLGWVVAPWLLGVGVFSLRNLGGWLLARRLVREGSPLAEEVNQHLARLVKRMKITSRVRVLQSHQVDSPVVLGWRDPVILVPPNLGADEALAEWDAVLAHELSHVRRRDYLVNLMQVVAETLLFYHPAVWWLSRSVRIEREYCCDDAAVVACGEKVTYAKALAALARRPAPALALAIFGGSESMIVERVRRVLATSSSGQHASRAGLTLSLMALALLATALAIAGPQSPRLATAAELRPDEEKVADKAPAAKNEDDPQQKSVRQIFRPTTTKSGKTSWTDLAPNQMGNDRKELMMMVRAYRGDRWPVKIRGQEKPLFFVELIDGDENQIELRVTEGDTNRRLDLKLDKPGRYTVAGKSFVFTYGTTTAAGAEPQYVDYAFLFVTLKLATD